MSSWLHWQQNRNDMAKNKQDKMGHAKAEARAVVTKTEAGHGHTCTLCIQPYRHDDPKCINIGLAYNGICTVCSTVIDKAVENLGKELQITLNKFLAGLEDFPNGGTVA